MRYFSDIHRIMKNLSKILICLPFVGLVALFFLLFSFEEFQYFVFSKRDSVKLEYFHRDEPGLATSELMKKHSQYVDDVFIFTWEEQVFLVNTGHVGFFKPTATLRIEYPDFDRLHRGEWLLFTHLSGAGLWTPTILYFEDQDWIELPPRFFMHPYSDELPSLAKEPLQTKYYAPCIAYIKWYQENPTIDPKCKQFIINDYHKHKLIIILNWEAWTSFSISKITK